MILFLYIATLFYRVRTFSIWFMFETVSMVVGKTAFVEIWSHQNWRKMSAMWAVKILDNVKQNSNNMQTCSTKTKATSNCLFHILRMGGICRFGYRALQRLSGVQCHPLTINHIHYSIPQKANKKTTPNTHSKDEIMRAFESFQNGAGEWNKMNENTSPSPRIKSEIGRFRGGSVGGCRREGKSKYAHKYKDGY